MFHSRVHVYSCPLLFFFQTYVSFQTDNKKLKHKQPEEVIVYVGGLIQCYSIWFVFTSISFQYLIQGPKWWVGKLGYCPLQVWTEQNKPPSSDGVLSYYLPTQLYSATYAPVTQEAYFSQIKLIQITHIPIELNAILNHRHILF